MTFLADLVRRLRGGDASTRLDRRLERELERQRPRPQRAFAGSLRGELEDRWAAQSRPRALRALVAGLIVTGVILLAAALVVAGG